MAGKAAVLGLDGTPHSLLTELIRKGVMSKLGALVKDGVFEPMDSSLPEVSSVAWSSFMTASNPGEHGIYGFTELRPGTYSLYFPNSSHIKRETLWDAAGKAGKSSVVLNVPSTYPAKPLAGMLTAGFVAPDLKKATYPDSLYEYLVQVGYRTDVDTAKARESVGFLVDDLKQTLAKRREVMLHFLDNGDWDLFIGVVTETDRLHHYLWDAYEDEGHPFHGFFLDYYAAIDGLVGEFAARVTGKGVPLVMMSDHGFTRCEQEVYVNHWLRGNGYLSLSKNPAQSWEDIAAGTRAFAMDPSRIYINIKGKYPRGAVEPGAEYEELRAELTAGLAGLEVEGKRVLKAVYRKEEIYSGPCLEQAPDIVLLSERGFDLKGSLAKDALYGVSPGWLAFDISNTGSTLLELRVVCR